MKNMKKKRKQKPDDNIWEALKNNTNFIVSLFNNITAKGLGDFLQELTAVLKFGAYIDYNKPNQWGKPRYEPDNATMIKPAIAEYDDSGQAWRIFLANDRPSALRYIFMLLFFPKNYINKRSSGGYLTEAEVFMEKSCNPSFNLPDPPCKSLAGQSGVKKGGRSPKKLKDKQKNPKRKTKKIKRK